jgi:hypothetical protein
VSIVTVNPGICGFHARIVAEADEAFDVSLTITSGCEHIQQLAQQLTQVSPLQELRMPMPATSVYQAAGACKLHVACPVPSAIWKAVEVAAGLALPADVAFTVKKEE